MMTGKRPPFYDNKLKRHLVDPPSRYHPTVSTELDRCILKMIELDVNKRYQSVWEVISDIEVLADARYYY
jgi:hypothetical protein